MKRKEALWLRSVLEQACQSLNDTAAVTAVALYPAWSADVHYPADYRVHLDGVLYRCLTGHRSQPDWRPDAAPSLWAKVLIPDEGLIPAWEQLDSTNAYRLGDRVTHSGKTWISHVDYNVWEPGIYGWTEE